MFLMTVLVNRKVIGLLREHRSGRMRLPPRSDESLNGIGHGRDRLYSRPWHIRPKFHPLLLHGRHAARLNRYHGDGLVLLDRGGERSGRPADDARRIIKQSSADLRAAAASNIWNDDAIAKGLQQANGIFPNCRLAPCGEGSFTLLNCQFSQSY